MESTVKEIHTPGAQCIRCAIRKARNRFALLCLPCMAQVQEEVQAQIRVLGPIGQKGQ